MSTHIYFDLDGTLTNPYEGISKCILYALDELGFPHPDAEYLQPPVLETFLDPEAGHCETAPMRVAVLDFLARAAKRSALFVAE